MEPYHKTRNIYVFCMNGIKAIRKREAQIWGGRQDLRKNPNKKEKNKLNNVYKHIGLNIPKSIHKKLLRGDELKD